MRNRSYKANNSKNTSLNSNLEQFVAAKRSNGNWCATIETGVENRFKEHATTAPAVGLKGKGLIEIEVQNVVDGLIRLEIMISVKSIVKESSERNNSIKGSSKDKKKGGAKNRLPVRRQGTKTFEDLRVRSSNNTEANLVTKSKNKSFKNRNRSDNANSKGPLKSNFIAQIAAKSPE